jgi:hypothetical protein
MRLEGMVQRSFGGWHVMMDACREVALSGVVVASVAGTMKFIRTFTLKLARQID